MPVRRHSLCHATPSALWKKSVTDSSAQLR